MDRLSAGEVAIYLARPDLARAPHRTARYGDLLGDEERTRLARYRFEEDRDEHFVTRVLVRIALSRHRPGDPGSWRFRENDHGRPEIDPPCGLRFNATNSHGLVACAVTEESEVGIDVEPRLRLEQILEVATAVFSETELGELRALGADIGRDRGSAISTLPPKDVSDVPRSSAGADGVLERDPGTPRPDEGRNASPPSGVPDEHAAVRRHHRRERAPSAAPEPARERALALWTLKEAYIKARGIGLGLPLQRMSMTFGPSGSVALVTTPDVDPDPWRWRFHRIDLGSHVLAIAVESLAGSSITIRAPVTLLED